MKSLYSLLFLFSLGLTIAAQVPSHVPNDGLIAWYEMDGNLSDSSPHGHDGTATNLSSATDRYGIDGGCLSFSGSVVPNTNRTQIANDAFGELPISDAFEDGMTISIWALEAPTSDSEFLQRRNNNSIDFTLGRNDDGGVATHMGFEAFAGPGEAGLDSWHHYALTYDEETIKLYIDGVLSNSKSANQNVNAFANWVGLGKYTYYGGLTHFFFFNGLMDELGFWNRSLSSGEIEALFQSQENPSITGCMDEAACNFDPEATEDDGSCLSVHIETSASAVCEGDGITAQAFVNNVLASFEESYATVNETGTMLVVPGEYESVQAALSASSDGDTILVMPGQFIGTYNFPQTHGVHLISAQGPSETVLDGNNSESVIAINGEFEYSVKGFTITRGRAFQYSTICNGKMGGGMEICGANTIVNVEDNLIIDNAGMHRGGGIRVASPNCIVRRNVIAFNSMPYGWANSDGGAGVCIQATDITFENNTVAFNNDSGGYPYGAGVHMNDVEGGSFRNNIIFHNLGGPAIWRDAESAIPVEYCDINQDVSGEGNLNEDPMFEDEENNDFHLNGASPCIDAGDPSMLDADGTVSDLGAFPFYQASPDLGVSLLWSTGDTTAIIQIEPTNTLNLEVVATLNGVSCNASEVITVYAEGCADEDACNYSETAACNLGCVYPVLGAGDCDEGSVTCGPGTLWDAEMQMCLPEMECDSLYNPDVDFDGFIGLTDLLAILIHYNNEWPPWECGDPLEYQGYDYATVQIGDQCWFAENLKVENYRNGDAIMQVNEASTWQSLSEGGRRIYGLGDMNCGVEGDTIGLCSQSSAEVLNFGGYLYNWYVVAEGSNVCPNGWHAPDNDAFDELLEHAENLSAGLSGLKSTEGWVEGSEGSNQTGFRAIGSGYGGNLGNFASDGHFTGFWSANASSGTNAHHLQIDERPNSAPTGGVFINGNNKKYALSIRCIKDTEQ